MSEQRPRGEEPLLQGAVGRLQRGDVVGRRRRRRGSSPPGAGSVDDVSGDLVEVRGKLNSGDLIAQRGTDELRPGERVQTRVR